MNLEYKNCYQRALSLLSRRAYFTKKLKDKLKSLDFSPDLIDQVILELTDKKYLNDQEYAKSKILSWKMKGIGPHQIKNKLQILNLKYSDFINQESNIESETIDESKNILNYLLKSKQLFLERIKSNPLTFKEKLYRHLIYKGHEISEIKKVWKKLMHDEIDM